MDEYSPWGSTDEQPSSELVYHSTSKVDLSYPARRLSTVSTWGDDGGWGTALQYGNPNDDTEGEKADVEITIDDIEAEGLSAKVSTDEPAKIEPFSVSSSDGWTASAFNDILPSTIGDAKSSSPSNDKVDPASFFRRPDLASSPDLGSSKDVEDEEIATEVVIENSDWGNYGDSPVLPTLTDLALKSPSESKSWEREADWSPPELPEPLPSFGHAFAGQARRESKDSGWGLPTIGEPISGWSTTGEPHSSASPEVLLSTKGEDQWGVQSSTAFKSIPATLVDRLKNESSQLAHSNWTVDPDAWDTRGLQENPNIVPLLKSLSEPPDLSAANHDSSVPPITLETPLSSLFRRTTTTYPAFREGLDKTALKAAETLKGTSSAAYRSARFGLLTRGEPGATNGAMESSLKESASGAMENTTSENASSVPQREEFASPSRIGRFFGRWRRDTSDSSAAKEASPRSSSENPNINSVGWTGDDLAIFSDHIAAHETAPPKDDRSYSAQPIEDEVGRLFGDGAPPEAQYSHIKTVSVADDFGILSSFAEAPRATRTTPKRTINKALDPFDPFGVDDVDEDAPRKSTSLAHAQPILAFSAQPSLPKSLRPASSKISFPAIAAPQARSGLLTNNANDAPVESIFAPAIHSPTLGEPLPRPTSSSPPLSASSLPSRQFVSPPPRISRLSPKPRIAVMRSMTPEQLALSASGEVAHFASSASASGFFAPPPPPAQPINKTLKAPLPPLLTSLQGLSTSHTTTPSASQHRPITPLSKNSGPLSLDDLSFFENL